MLVLETPEFHETYYGERRVTFELRNQSADLNYRDAKQVQASVLLLPLCSTIVKVINHVESISTRTEKGQLRSPMYLPVTDFDFDHSLWTRSCSFTFKEAAKLAASFAATISSLTSSSTTPLRNQPLLRNFPSALL